ncbi:hypothetical protein BJ138DRAFT_1130936 [Hygrophoropsis aurantiaca]|uniref:Uncharacterized protein n=1 Tax=Hygrophoropsis aurantiaca TaxID=72124 RepID=A0ACB7ZUD7_9AGAM|nr:hypothetical protein BJ138DRAFT_1130936 [Hygrophoropsis aurantiaca]
MSSNNLSAGGTYRCGYSPRKSPVSTRSVLSSPRPYTPSRICRQDHLNGDQSHVRSSPVRFTVSPRPTSPPSSSSPLPSNTSSDTTIPSFRSAMKAEDIFNTSLGNQPEIHETAYELPSLTDAIARPVPVNISQDLLDMARARRAVCQARKKLFSQILAEQDLRTRFYRRRVMEADDAIDIATTTVGTISAMIRNNGGSLYSSRQTRNHYRRRAQNVETSDIC